MDLTSIHDLTWKPAKHENPLGLGSYRVSAPYTGVYECAYLLPRGEESEERGRVITPPSPPLSVIGFEY